MKPDFPSFDPIKDVTDGQEFVSDSENDDMPMHLRQAIIADGMAYVEKAYGSGMSRGMKKAIEQSELESADEFYGEFRPRGVPVGRRNLSRGPAILTRSAAQQIAKLRDVVSRFPKVREIGSLVVAAAGLLALTLFLRQPAGTGEAPELASAKHGEPSLILMDDKSVSRNQLGAFLTNPPHDMLRVACKTEDQESTVGELWWSDSQQSGFVTLSGLEVNDPDQFQYQVWTIDANQKYPVTCGVFNVVDQNRTVIRLRPNLKIKKAVQFMVTQERPGGVVASSRENIVAVATTKQK